jgi:hypothetical protein
MLFSASIEPIYAVSPKARGNKTHEAVQMPHHPNAKTPTLMLNKKTETKQ